MSDPPKPHSGEGYPIALIAWNLGRIADALEASTRPREPSLADYNAEMCKKYGHSWEWFYVRQGQPAFCRRCGLQAHS